MQTPAFPALEILGIVAFAASGIAVARASGLDLVGCYFAALLTSLGGGTVRDVLITHRPFYWSSHEWLLVAILGLVLIAFVPGMDAIFTRFSKFNYLADSIGVGTFSLSGLLLALQYGYGPVASIMMAVITAIVGGVLRDLVCGQIPYAFQRTELCATCAVTGCVVFFACDLSGLETLASYILGGIVASTMRFIALLKRVKLPV